MSDDDNQETAVSLFAATVLAVDRAAQCFVDDRSQDDLFGWAFWELLYGPNGDWPSDTGLIYWGLDNYDDC